MGDDSACRATIPVIADDAARPLWSVMIPTYNCGAHLRVALASVLAQDPGPEVMQIEVVDDHSTDDDPAAVVQEIGSGRVGLFRQETNVGHTQNFATCLIRSRGKLIHLLHGDDYVLDGFYRKMARAFSEPLDIGAAFCRQIFLDDDRHSQDLSPLEQRESGRYINALERLAMEQRIMTPSIVVHREVYETLGSFDSRLVCSEDWEMWVRIAAHYPIWYEVQPLAAYRMHANSNTGRHVRSAEDIRYTRRAIEMFRSYLPPETRGRISRKARETYALSTLQAAYDLCRRGDGKAAWAQLREALLLRCSPRVVAHFTRLLLRLLVQCCSPKSGDGEVA